MARTDTLGNFLTDVAEAIRNKTGKTDKLTPASFDTEIESIVSNGGDSSESILPSGYTQLEYVKSNGTQRIDTGVLPTEETDFETTFSSQDTYGSSNFGSIFGTRYTYDTNAYHLGTFNARYGDDLATGTFLFAGTFYSGYMKTDGSKQTVTYKSGIYTGGDGRTWDLTAKTTTPSNNIYLFACYDTLANNTIDPGRVTLYSCSFSENGEKIRDFIPARRNSDAAIGLFDIVGNTFYISNIGDPLVAGPDVAASVTEDLSEELSAQDSALTTQELIINDIISALEGKSVPVSGGGVSNE